MSKFLKFTIGIFVSVMLYVIALIFVPRFPCGPFKLYSDLTPEQREAIIPYKILSNEGSHPYGTSKFPDVRNCIIKDEALKDVPDLRLIDWDIINTLDDFDVCLWRIFSSLGEQSKVEAWFDFHPYSDICAHIECIPWPYSKPTKLSKALQKPHYISLKWYKQLGLPFPTSGIPTFEEMISPELFIAITWDDNGNLTHVRTHWVRSM